MGRQGAGWGSPPKGQTYSRSSIKRILWISLCWRRTFHCSTSPWINGGSPPKKFLDNIPKVHGEVHAKFGWNPSSSLAAKPCTDRQTNKQTGLFYVYRYRLSWDWNSSLFSVFSRMYTLGASPNRCETATTIKTMLRTKSLETEDIFFNSASRAKSPHQTENLHGPLYLCRKQERTMYYMPSQENDYVLRPTKESILINVTYSLLVCWFICSS